MKHEEKFPSQKFHVTDEGYHLMRFLKNRGEPVNEIAQKLQSTAKTVRFWLSRSFPPSQRPKTKRCARARAQSIKERRKLVIKLLSTTQRVRRVRYTPKKRLEREIFVTLRPYDSTRRICRALYSLHKIKVSPSTVHHDLLVEGKRAKKRRRGPVLDEETRINRVAFCRAMLRTPQQLHILFSDECYISVNPRTNIWQWVNSSEEAEHLEITQGATQIMVWGVIGKGFRRLVLVEKDGSLTKVSYRDRILTPVIAALREQCRSGAVFQQDGARAHCDVQQWLRRRGVHMLAHPWPPRSPDLSPIETIWSWLKSAVSRRAPFGIEELMKFIAEEWQAISQDSIDRLVQGFCERCRSCVACAGRLVRPPRSKKPIKRQQARKSQGGR